MDSFIIGGKLYDPETALILCRQTAPLEETTLFQSVKGAFFSVTVSGMDGTQTAQLLNRAQALEFLDANPCAVVEENYIKAFGEPEEG